MHSVAVVPIFVNAGAAVLPAVLAGAASFVALLFKPKALLAACRRRPWVPAVVVASAGLAWALGAWAFGGGSTARAAGDGEAAPAAGYGPVHRDWAEVARALIRREKVVLGPSSKPAGTGGKPVGLGRDAGRCGYDGGMAPLGLTLLWPYRPKDGVVYLSSPVVAGERVYGASYQPSGTSGYGVVFCLNARTGERVWATDSVKTPDGVEEPLKPFFSSPALSADGASLVIGQGLHADEDCSLLCLDAATGEVRWRVETTLHIESSPAIHGDVVVVGAGAIEGRDHKPTTDPGFVLGVRISDGKELWRAKVKDPESSPAIDADGIAYIGSGFNGNQVVALRTAPEDELKAKGLPREVWHVDAPYPVTGAVTVADDLIIVGAGNSDYVFTDPNPAGVVLAIDRKTKDVKWRTPMPDAVLGPIACRDGKLICPVHNGEVVALNLADGKPAWRQAVSGQSPVLAGCAFTGKYVYAVSKDGFLAVLDAADGRVLEKTRLNEEGKPAEGLCFSTPTIAGGRLFVGTETGGLRCYAGTR